jgi:hypothetical protein
MWRVRLVLHACPCRQRICAIQVAHTSIRDYEAPDVSTEANAATDGGRGRLRRSTLRHRLAAIAELFRPYKELGGPDTQPFGDLQQQLEVRIELAPFECSDAWLRHTRCSRQLAHTEAPLLSHCLPR